MPPVLNPVLEIDAGMKEARSPLNKKHERFLVSINFHHFVSFCYIIVFLFLPEAYLFKPFSLRMSSRISPEAFVVEESGNLYEESRSLRATCYTQES